MKIFAGLDRDQTIIFIDDRSLREDGLTVQDFFRAYGVTVAIEYPLKLLQDRDVYDRLIMMALERAERGEGPENLMRR